jgi:type IV pilus assembly protein PilA
MKSLGSRWFIIAALTLLVAACAKQPDVAAKPAAVTLVPAAEQSRHFEAVNSHLELGGTLYGYADIDGDALELAQTVQMMARQIAATQPQLGHFSRIDFAELFGDLGLNDVKAIGLSSVHETGGYYRNRAFLYTPDGRHGLFAVFGGAPGRFVGARLAPPDADFYAEHEFNMTAVYDTVKAVIAKVSGPDALAAFEKQVRTSGAAAKFSLLDFFEGLNGRATIIVSLDPQSTFTIPGPRPTNIPAFTALVRVDGIGPSVEGMLTAKPELFVATQEGARRVYTYKAPPMIKGLNLVFAVEGKALYLATSAAFLHDCIDRTQGLDTNPAFSAALASLGPEGNGLTWVTPRFFSRLKDLGKINPNASFEAKRFFDAYAANIPEATEPMLSVRTNLPDGILIRSTWNRSLKADLALFTVYNPVTVGLIAAMAIPAFQKVRTESQARAVMNNLRALSAAADQYYLEKGATTATYDDLVGPDKVVKALVPVAGEDYHTLVFAQGRRLRISLPDGRTFAYPELSYPPQKTLPARTGAMFQRAHVVNNLRAFQAAADRYYAANGVTSATYQDIMAMTPHPEVYPVMGEDYSSLVFSKGVPLRIDVGNGQTVQYPMPLIFVPTPTPTPQANAPSSHRWQPTGGKYDGILQNLQALDDAANQYYADRGTTTTTFDQLVGPGKAVPAVNPVQGEDYHSILFKQGHPLRLYLTDGTAIAYPPPDQN